MHTVLYTVIYSLQYMLEEWREPVMVILVKELCRITEWSGNLYGRWEVQENKTEVEDFLSFNLYI